LGKGHSVRAEAEALQIRTYLSMTLTDDIDRMLRAESMMDNVIGIGSLTMCRDRMVHCEKDLDSELKVNLRVNDVNECL
jgi:hypothetical protein